MLPENSEQPSGYPPVTEAEERTAGRTDESGGRQKRATDNSRGLDTPQADITDAIAALFDKHRAKVAAATTTSETRRFALDLLDSVRREALQTILSKS
jgi:hypothetical protein